MLNKKECVPAGRKLIYTRFFTSSGIALVSTVLALYLSSFGLSDSKVGFISSFLVLISVIFSVASIPLIESINHKKTLKKILFLYAIIYFIIGFNSSLTLFLILISISMLLGVLRISIFSILIRDNTDDESLNREEGLLYSILNIGWLIGPIIAGFLMAKFGFSIVFFVIATSFFVAFLIVLKVDIHGVKKKRKKVDKNVLLNLKRFFGEKRLYLPFIMASGIGSWMGLLYIYVPLFIITAGLGKFAVGLFLGLSVIPMILLETYFGKASLKHGFRKFFFIGFFGLFLSSILVFFLEDIYFQLAILILASFFIAMIEPIQETFFFKQVKGKEEERFFPIFQTSPSAGSFFGKFIIAIALLFLPTNYAYLVMSVLMLSFSLIALGIDKNIR